MRRLIRSILLEPGESLSQKVARSSFWTLASQSTTKTLAFLSTVILARLLDPGDFGLAGIALMSAGLLDVLSQTGIESALIQKQGSIDDYVDVAWTVRLVRAIGLFLVLCAVAHPVATFFGDLRAVAFIRVMGLTYLLYALQNMGPTYFSRNLDMRKNALLDIVGCVSYLLVSLSVAILLKSAWAIVLGSVGQYAAQTVTTYLIHPHRLRFNFSSQKTGELLHFGKWLFGASIVSYFCNQGDSILLGRMLGTVSLGHYRMATNISDMPARSIAVISNVVFPAYSRMQDDMHRLKKAFLKTVRILTAMTTPICLGIAVLAPEFTRIVFGSKWMPMAPVLRILAFTTVLRITIGASWALFYGCGKPAMAFYQHVVRLVVLVATLYPFTRTWGMDGTAYAALLSVVLTIPVWLIGCRQQADVRIFDLVRQLAPPVASGCLMSLVVLGLGLFMNQYSIFGLCVSVAAGAVTFLGCMAAIGKISSYRIFDDFKEVFALLGGRISS